MARIEQGNPGDPLQWEIRGWSPDSQYVSILNFGSGERLYKDLSIMKYDGTDLHQLDKQANAVIQQIEWSPNGKFIAYERAPVSNNHTLILIIDPAGREIARFDLSGFIQINGLGVGDLTWSPDNKKLAFHTEYYADTDSKLYVLDIQSGIISDIIRDKSVCISDIFGWSSDGEKILFDAVNCREHMPGDSETVTYSINMDGSQLKPLTPKGYSTLHWTPDGKSIIMNRYPNSGIYLMDIDGNNQRKLVDNGLFVSWIKP
jgi:Tol biopolymer transport system component